MTKILFQGDSITDAGRSNQSDPHALGTGYPYLIAAELLMQDPSLEFFNTGISGNRVVDLYARWKKDCINLKPDILTILIGVNDVWHERDFQNGVEPEKFEFVYRLLLDEVKKKLPDTKIILMGAFLTEGTIAEGEDWKSFYDDVKIRRDITKKLAEEYKLEYIDLQKVFDDALSAAPANHWTVEGVHPQAGGHALIKKAWLEVYNKICR